MAKSSSSSENEACCSKSCMKNTDSLNTKITELSEKLSDCLEFNVESKNNRIERLTNELEQIKKEKEGLDSKLTGFESAAKDLDTLLESQRSDKNKEGLGYSAVPPFCSSLLTLSHSIESNTSDLQSNNFFVSELGESSGETARKPPVKYAEMYRNTSQSPKVRGIKLEDPVRTKRSRGTKSKEMVDYILQVKIKLSTKKLEDLEAGHQV
nr:hypothetical protein [Tanacetum cinerariifolium]